VGGELRLGLRGDVDDVQVLFSNERQEFPVGAEGDEFLDAWRVGKAHGAAAVKVTVIEIIAMLEPGAAALWIHVKERAARQGLRPLLVEGRQRSETLRKFLVIVKG